MPEGAEAVRAIFFVEIEGVFEFFVAEGDDVVEFDFVADGVKIEGFGFEDDGAPGKVAVEGVVEGIWMTRGIELAAVLVEIRGSLGKLATNRR